MDMSAGQPNPNRKPTLDRPFVRLILAAAIVGVLMLVALLVRTQRGGTASPPATLAEPTFADDANAGPLDNAVPVIGQPAPSFALRRADGTVVRLADLRGKVVWINFWATWCVPCKKELPDIQKVFDEKQAAGLEVITINVKERPDDALAFFADRGLTLPLVFDDDGAVYEQYRLQGLPDSFFIDRDGNLAALQYGFLTEEKMRERLAKAGLP